jgi:putative phosphoribosyl transferase
MNSIISQKIEIDTGKVKLIGRLKLPPSSQALVIIASCSGTKSSHLKNYHLSQSLLSSGYCTYQSELLSESEVLTNEKNPNIAMITERLQQVINYLQQMPQLQKMDVALISSGTCGAAVLRAAAKNSFIKAVAVRGARTDLAMEHLHKIKAPVLLIAGNEDEKTFRLNIEAFKELDTDKRLAIIENAKHRFNSYQLIEAAAFIGDWFKKYLIPKRSIWQMAKI